MQNKNISNRKMDYSSLEKTMSPLILLFRFGDKNYHPELELKKEDRCEFGIFKQNIINDLWNFNKRDGKIKPSEYFNMVRNNAMKISDSYHGDFSKNQFNEILENTIMGHLHELDLGTWGKDLMNIYTENLCNFKMAS